MSTSMQRGIVVLALIFANTCATRYIIDVIEISTNTTTPDAVEFNLYCVKPARGIFAASGIMNFKVDFDTDITKGELKVLYSSNGISYQMTPFHLPLMTVTDLYNQPCARSFWKSLQECCTSAEMPEPFVSPFTKRVMECENCLYPTDSIPSAMRPGYYKQVVIVDGLPIIDFAISILIKLEYDY